jgi:hypothetical protein
MRIYAARFQAVAVTAAQDFFEVLAGTAVKTSILGWSLSQTTDLGDAAEEVLRIETVRGIGTVTSGSGGGSNPTAQPIDDKDAAFTGTVEINNTTRMATGTGSLESLDEYGWNIRIPWEKEFIPEKRPVLAPGDRWTLSLVAAPADSVTISGTVWIAEG